MLICRMVNRVRCSVIMRRRSLVLKILNLQPSLTRSFVVRTRMTRYMRLIMVRLTKRNFICIVAVAWVAWERWALLLLLVMRRRKVKLVRLKGLLIRNLRKVKRSLDTSLVKSSPLILLIRLKRRRRMRRRLFFRRFKLIVSRNGRIRKILLNALPCLNLIARLTIIRTLMRLSRQMNAFSVVNGVNVAYTWLKRVTCALLLILVRLMVHT